MCDYKERSVQLKFRKDVKELKIPDNYNYMPAEREKIVEFILEIEWLIEIFVVKYHIID